ncbi:MAG: M14 family zinc carboxypeptidase [Nocardioidaceae bacterium]
MNAPSTTRRLSCLGLTAVIVGALAAAGPSYAVSPRSSHARAAHSPMHNAPSAKAEAPHRAVLSHRIIGYSVKRHPIRAFELGSRRAHTTVVALAAMHGNETAGSVVLSSLMNGRPIKGVHLWAIPRDNPDGVLRDSRHNAHGVDLNRNFPVRWKRLRGWYNSGPQPNSEPETRRLERFLNRVDPDYVVTMHSPLHGVDVYGAKDRPFARRLARQLRLPIKEFNCSGVCHGTLTQWFNKRHVGACVTVEFGENPSRRYLQGRAARGLVRAIGGHF